ncbi:MAG: hypothetical protein MK135_08940, partial [Polyangiaceae bacterium]|nr:hypothetical protein [Polyangiaceae bacterium]
AKEADAAGIVLRKGSKQASPDISCHAEGCLVVWDNEQAGALAAYIPHNQSQALWHQEFDSGGQRPAVARSQHNEWAVAYFSDDRLRLLPANNYGVGQPSIISRVSGFQPRPALIAENNSNSWLMAWRDFEAGHREIFVARAQCVREEKE